MCVCVVSTKDSWTKKTRTVHYEGKLEATFEPIRPTNAAHSLRGSTTMVQRSYCHDRCIWVLKWILRFEAMIDRSIKYNVGNRGLIVCSV